jgi:hypothetical protein
MERKLRGLFDYQKFEGNTSLQSVINSVHSRYGTRELSFEDMEHISAAGLVHFPPEPDKEPKK